MSDIKYRHIVRAIAETPWALEPAKLAAICELVALRAAGRELTPDEVQARIGAAPAQRPAATTGTVAVIPVRGVIAPRVTAMQDTSGGTSVEQLSASLRAALADSRVDAILLDVDSPGGSTALISEVAAEVRAAREWKPVWAIANTTAASAAYWIASQADRLIVTPSGAVGSIGIIVAHEDISKMLEAEGVSMTLITAGEHKGETSPYGPLSDEARAALQEQVDEFYSMFTADVAKGRGVPVETVRNGFGEGRMVLARQALEQGMVDGIDSFEATVTALQKSTVRPVTQTSQTALVVTGNTTATGTTTTGVLSDDPGREPGDTDHQAAMSGLSFAVEAVAVRDAVTALAARTRSLAEWRRGDLTVAKQQQLQEICDALTVSQAELEQLLASTTSHQHAEAVLREAARYELQRANVH